MSDGEDKGESRLRAFGRFLWDNKLWWMTPMALCFFLFAFLVYLASQSPVTPFVYTLF